MTTQGQRVFSYLFTGAVIMAFILGGITILSILSGGCRADADPGLTDHVADDATIHASTLTQLQDTSARLDALEQSLADLQAQVDAALVAGTKPTTDRAPNTVGPTSP
jgi:hypothetical protein